MIKFRIKDLHDAAVKDLHSLGHYKTYERNSRKNDAIMSELFNRTKSGMIKGFYLISDTELKAYHRSTKEAGKIQLSSGFYRNGELIPCYDSQLETATDMIREGYTKGLYQIIA